MGDKRLIEHKTTCPLGHTCEKVVDGVVETCAWYITLSGGNPMTGEEMKDEKACAIAWQPILMIEAARETKGVAASVQSLRNETTKRMDAQLALELVDNEKYIEHS